MQKERTMVRIGKQNQIPLKYAKGQENKGTYNVKSLQSRVLQYRILKYNHTNLKPCLIEKPNPTHTSEIDQDKAFPREK